MEKNVLSDFETFSEFPDNYIKITEKSNYYFIQKENERIIAKKKVDSILMLENDKISIDQSYYNIKTGDLVLKTHTIYDKNLMMKEKIIASEKKVKIILLSLLLGIKDNDECYLSMNEIDFVINNKKKCNKEYVKKAGK